MIRYRFDRNIFSFRNTKKNEVDWPKQQIKEKEREGDKYAKDNNAWMN